jgi:ABC-2 type transport system permease protein
MVGFLTSMKLTVLRRSMSGARAASLILGGLFGLAAAVGTVLLGLITLPPSAAVPFYAVLSLLWTLGWLLGPMLTGGDAILRLEYFNLFPVSPRRLAVGLFGAAFAGITPVITFLAFGFLLVVGIRTGVTAALIAVPAIVLQLALVVLLSRTTMQALGSAMRSRVGWELSSLVVGLVIAFLNSGWFALGFFVKLFTGHWASHVATTVKWLPSGWAVDAVAAAGRSDWPIVAASLGGLVVLCGVLLLAWASLLGRHLVRGTVTTRSGVARPSKRLPGSPFGAVVGKELRLWQRDPRRSRFVRIAFWIGVFTGLYPLLDHSLVLLPWAGVVAVLFAGALAANLYGMDAGALWLTMVTPGIERTDVRARQFAWLLFVVPTALVLTGAAAFFRVNDAMWPWVLAALPAIIGAAAGLMPLVSLLSPAPFPDRPGGNPLDGFSDESGDQVRLQTLIVLFAELLLAMPAGAVVLAGHLTHDTTLQWLGVPVGVVTGVLFAWLFGQIAYRRLRAKGPEILDIMRKGPQRDPVKLETDEPDAVAPAGQDLPSGIASVVGLLMTLGILMLIPQGIVTLVLGFAHVKVRGWFLALHFTSPDRVLISIGFILLGLASISGALALVWTTKRKQRRAAGEAAHALSGGGDEAGTGAGPGPGASAGSVPEQAEAEECSPAGSRSSRA